MEPPDHLEKVRQNWAFLSLLPPTADHVDWQVTVLFYTALHLASLFIHECGQDHGKTHVGRNQTLRRLVRQRALSEQGFDDYMHLYGRSRSLRYEELTAEITELHQLVSVVFRPLEGELLRITNVQPLPRLLLEG